MKKDLVVKQKDKFFGISFPAIVFIGIVAVTIILWAFIVYIYMEFGIVGVAIIVLTALSIPFIATLIWKIKENKNPSKTKEQEK